MTLFPEAGVGGATALHSTCEGTTVLVPPSWCSSVARRITLRDATPFESEVGVSFGAGLSVLISTFKIIIIIYFFLVAHEGIVERSGNISTLNTQTGRQ